MFLLGFITALLLVWIFLAVADYANDIIAGWDIGSFWYYAASPYHILTQYIDDIAAWIGGDK